MVDCIEENGANGVQNLIKTFVKEDPSLLILQSIQTKDDLELTDGKLLISHNPKLMANLTTDGKISVYFDKFRGETEGLNIRQKDIILKEVNLQCLKDKIGSETLISEAIWCKSITKEDYIREFEITPTLVLLEKSIEITEEVFKCNFCKKFSGIQFLTIIQFSRIRDFEDEDYEVLELDLKANSQNGANFNKPISIDFEVLNSQKTHSTSQQRTKIRYCRIPVQKIFSTFFDKKIEFSELHNICKGCFSFNSVQVFVDTAMESGFVIIMANMVLLSLDFNETCSLTLNRRFLIQDFKNPQIQFSGFAIQSGWLVSIIIDHMELLIWNFYQGIAFKSIKLSPDYFEFLPSNNKRVDILAKLSFGRDLSKLFMVIDYLNHQKQVEVIVIDLNVIFSQFLSAYCILKFLIDMRGDLEPRVPDPGMELRKRVQISSGSIPHVQLHDEYSSLTVYPEAFYLGDEHKVLNKIINSLSDESNEYLDSTFVSKNLNKKLDLTRCELGWPLLFNRSWFTADLSFNYQMNKIIISTVENIMARNNLEEDFIEHFEELSNNMYLESISAPLKKSLESIPELILSKSSSPRQNIKNYSDFKQNSKLLSRKSSFIYSYIIPITVNENELNVHQKLLCDIVNVDIIASSETVFIQFSIRGSTKRHLGFCVSEENGNLLILQLNFHHEYSIMILNLSRTIDWHYFTLKDINTNKYYVGLYSKTMSLLGLIYSNVRYNDIEHLIKICKYNQVDPCIIPLIQLEIGFKHEELKLIKFSLENTPMSLNIKIVKLAQSLLQDINLRLSSDFTRQASKLFLNFCLDKIKFYSENGLLINKEDANQENTKVDEFLQEISYYLSVFRVYLNIDSGLTTNKEVRKCLQQADDAGNELANESNIKNSFDNKSLENGILSKTDMFIRDQVILGHYSSLINWYLNVSKEKNPQVFRIKVLHEIYKLICTLSTNSLTLSIHMLRQIGVNTTQYLKSILYYTSRREIRRRLINHLKHFGALNDDDIDLIQFNNELESYYPNNCYTVERNRTWTSLFTNSIPYNILSDCNLESEFKDKISNEYVIQEEIENEVFKKNSFDSKMDFEDYYFYGDNDQGSHVNNPIFSAMTYPFGGLRALKSGLSINMEFNQQYIEDLKKINQVTSISAKKLSYNKEFAYTTEKKENIEMNNRDFFYSNFPTEAIAAWEDLKCCEIEDFDLELNSQYNQEKSDELEIENDRNSNNNLNTIMSSIPEQEGNDFIRLNNGKLVSIKNSSCKHCLDLYEDEELEVEEKLLNFENEFGQSFISRNNSNESFSLSSQKEHMSSNSSIVLSQSPITDSIEKTQPNTTLFGDHNSKRGDLTWLKLHRQRKEMNNNFNNFGYLCHSLKFLSEWSFDVSIRVVIEKTHLQVCFIWNRLLSGFQTPSKKNEALVYSLLILIIKKTAREFSNNFDYNICLQVAKKITTSIYIAVFGFMFSHFEWKNIPDSINYLDKTLFLLIKYFNVEESYKYDLINEIISLNFKSSPRFIVEVFLNSLDSSGIIPIHHLKTDLLQEKINRIEMDRYNNVKYIVDKCISYGTSGIELFKYYLMRSNDFTSKECLYTFLQVIESSKNFSNKEIDQPKKVDYDDYLNIIYIFLGRKQDIILLSLKRTFDSIKSSIDDLVYRSLINESSNNELDSQSQEEIHENEQEKSYSPGYMLNILIKYFNYYYEGISDHKDEDLHDKNTNQFELRGKDKRINISPYYILSILFSLEIPRKEVYSQEFYTFLSKFFPSLLQVLKKSFLTEKVLMNPIQENNDNSKIEMTNEDSNLGSTPPFNITQIIKMTDKDSEPLIRMMELYPELSKKIKQDSNNMEEFFELFYKNLKKVTETDEIEKSQEISDDQMSLPILHYLSMGRPFFAYTLLCLRHAKFHINLNYKQITKKDLKCPELSLEEKIDIYQSVYTLAIRNFTRDSVVCSCIVFISMLKLPTELLCTDIRVARCIYIHQIHKNNNNGNFKVNYDTQEMDIEIDSENSGKISEILDLFLKFGPPKISPYLENNDDNNSINQNIHKEFQDNQKYSSSLFSVLKMLEEAAWASGDIVNGGNCDENENETETEISNDNQGIDTIELIPHTPIWHLVATFCRIHDLPRSLTLLHELARKGEWVTFLQECDSQKCPLETVGNIINEYMSENPVLKLHLKIALNINDENEKNTSILYKSNKESDYIIKLVEWDKLFYSLNLDDEKKIQEFYDWSVNQVFKEIIQEMSINRVILYFSLFEEHYLNLVDKFPSFKSRIKGLINSSINSYLLMEIISTLCYISFKENIENLQAHELWTNIFEFSSNIEFEENETESLKKSIQEFVLIVFQDNDFVKILNNLKNERDHHVQIDDILTEKKLLNRFIEETKDLIINMNELKLVISSESLNILFSEDSSNKNQIETLMFKDETTIILWKLLSNLNESGLLSRASNLFYGEETQISMIFKSIESLYSYDVEKAIENLNKILIYNEEGIEKDREILGFLPRKELVRSYFEEEFLKLYGKMTIEDHRMLWTSINEMNLEKKYPKDETLFFEIEKHVYKLNVIDLLYLNLEDYQVSFEQLENWLCISEKMLLRDFYQEKKYKLFLKYLEESSSRSFPVLLNDNEVLNWLEGSFLSEVAIELDNFTMNTNFKSSSLRIEFINNYFWIELKNLSCLIQQISMELTPLFLVKISIYCWFLIEKLERWLSTFDQVILISISIHFLFEALEIMNFRKSENFKDNNIRNGILEFIPKYFDMKYIQECLKYAGYKLFLLLLSNIGFKDVKNDKAKVIIQGFSELLSQGIKKSLEITDFQYQYNLQYFELIEEIFLSNKGNPVIFTPSGYFNFKNVTIEIPFSIAIPLKISSDDYPVDSKNVHNCIQNIVNYMFDIALAFNIGNRFIPNMKNKLEVSKQRFDRKFKIFTQELYYCDSKTYTTLNSSDSNVNNELMNMENNSPPSSSINLSRNLQAWDSITDYLIEMYCISSIFTKVMLIWLFQSFSRNILNNSTNNKLEDEKVLKRNNDFNEFLVKSIRGSECSSNDNLSAFQGKNIIWRNFMLSFNENEELSLLNVTYRMKLQSILTLLQFTNQINHISSTKYSYYIENIKERMIEIIQESGLSENHLNGDFSILENYDESTLIKISIFILKVFSSNAIIPLFKEILELSILFEYENNIQENTSCNIIKFKTIQKCLKVIIINNSYIEKQQVDNMFIELIKVIIERFHNKPFLTSILYQICQLIMNPNTMIKLLAQEIELIQLKEDGNEINKIRELIYLHLTRYYLVMIDFQNEGIIIDNEYSQKIINDAISKIDELLAYYSKKEFDLVLFTNILLEIPEIPSLNMLNSFQINQIIMNLELDINDGTLKNYNSHILPFNWIRVLISQRILNIYDQKISNEEINSIIGLNNKPNINLISTKLNQPDLLAEFLVKKCLSSQWRTQVNFMYCKYGQYDLIVALQTLIESCEILKLTDYQQSYRVYQNLAGLFSLQLYFVSSYLRIKNDLDNKFLNNDIINQETKKSIYNKLSCIIKKEELDELFGDLNQNNNTRVDQKLLITRDYYRFEIEKIQIFNLDLIELFEVVADTKVCFNPSMVLMILNGYEAIYGPIIHSIWPRILFINSIIQAKFKFLNDYKLEFGFLDEEILLSMINIYKNSINDNVENLAKINGMTFYEFIKSEDNNLEDIEIDENTNIFDLALSWNERGFKEKLSSMKKEEILKNWTKLIQEYIEDLQLRITVCKMIDEDGLSDIIFLNKKLYNDKSLYKFALTSNIDC